MGNPIKYNETEKRKIMVKIDFQAALQWLARSCRGLPINYGDSLGYPIVLDPRFVQQAGKEPMDPPEGFLVFDICHDDLPVIEPGDDLPMFHVEHSLKKHLRVEKIEADPQAQWYAQ